MQIFSVQNNFYYDMPKNRLNKTFKAKGKPLELKYIIEKHSALIPERVLNEAKKILNSGNNKDLIDIHKEIYSPLLNCKSLEEAKLLFPEFNDMKKEVIFSRESVYTKNYRENCKGEFALDILREYWANLKTLDYIAKKYNYKSRNSFQWILDKINLPKINRCYSTLLKASNIEGNKLIASKTTAWNSLHPDLMLKKNKRAAQFCKTEEYKKAQAVRMIERDKVHPERKEKIGRVSKRTWELCPDVKEEMSKALNSENDFTKISIKKAVKGERLSEKEKVARFAFYKHFWGEHPELKEIYAEARKKAGEENRQNLL